MNHFVSAAFRGALVLCLGIAVAQAQEIPASAAENGDLWFVELKGAPTADGNSAANTKKEKAEFRKAAAAAGAKYQERAAYDVLFNGLAIKASPADRLKIEAIPGVKAVWPIETVSVPAPEADDGSSTNLETAIVMTGADIAHSELGITGKGVRVAVMDTGIDYDHADLGGDGTARSNSTAFPNARVVTGWDFVGDDFDAGGTPVPDPYPDDCNGHGSHVAGIVGANGNLTGVAPDVVFGAYRVFGCDGSTTSDIMLAAMERALADDMDVLNMSIGARAQWPQYPTAAAATRLLKKGMVVVASIGNNGPGGSVPDGPYAAGAPGVGADVIGVASFDNTHVAQLVFKVSPDAHPVGYNPAAGAPPPPTSGSLPMSKTGTPATADDGCPVWQAMFGGAPWPGGSNLAAGSQTGNAVLIRRGTCSFYAKAWNAMQAGASAVVLYNNAAGPLNPTVAAPTAAAPPITIPVAAILATEGALIDGRIAGGPTTLTWSSDTASTPLATAGLVSTFSSFGMAADLTLKPDIGAPGGSIFSTIPIENGTYGQNSGTSMSSPHVAGAVALLLEAEPGIPRTAVRSRLQNSADPAFFFLAPQLELLDSAHHQGAGLVDIDDAITADVDVTPGKLSLGESQAGPQTRTLTIRNRGGSSVSFDLSAIDAVSTGPKNPANYPTIAYLFADSTVSFSAPSVTVPPGASRKVDVTIAPNAGLDDQSQYGGYVVLTPQGGGKTYRVPYAGFVGDYQTVPVLTPTPNGFPWLAKLNAAGTTFTNQPAGATYTMIGNDVPYFLVHLDHHVRRYEFRITDAETGAPLHPVFSNFDEDEYVGRSLTATGFFAFAWDGTRAHSNGNNSLRKFVPDGSYVVTLRVLKALGTPSNPAHWETWASPVVTIDRP